MASSANMTKLLSDAVALPKSVYNDPDTSIADMTARQLWAAFLHMGDNRITHWTLMGSPFKVLSVIGVYLIFSTKLGPWLMRDRAPLNIRPIVIAYNIFMVLSSVYFCVLTIYYAFIKSRYSLICASNDSATNPYAQLMFDHAWWYVMLKVGELLDTAFFVLLKKETHISFLHLLHHSLALWTVWLDVNLGITGQTALFPILNCSVHVVMYTYYGLAALPKEIRPNLWWKKYVTQFQITQFLLLMLHGSVPIFYDCQFPPLMASLMTFEAGLFTYLFSDFYIKTYLKTYPKSIGDKPTKTD
ncbi:elongation of very long chain fatty acids protein 7-like [Varroa jacobsoni]|uniref:Elongation of very long chain fatty acids protein n=1 Tax=Varroa destructor TaxID=109461 RepID=A0A7M7JXR8_VARDE|nr:elongation of very long chain fatty acids protein 7-like [Varroa destructor]XP_022658688.1 elongation of very long chain fatty acids protein 7-like [Varroa destructor]XP_022658690.1 elongation of very long chain fatty acids protein 7-like [Varroa destructor]XP_022658691.1 elongation of very long chain fatty acids protein 7-like [Varroa destructor]XP_022699231.1 elongation of very long chain fatty acids protein 7-like [Varroa jacobsoni]XP_022699232.1 elongation of very long chain fatty acids